MDTFSHSWVITAHGDSPYIEDCVKSILNQTVKTAVMISTATESPFLHDLADNYGIQLYVKTGKDDVIENWNYAYNLASTEWVTLAHQDDIYLPNYVEELKKLHPKNKNTSIFFSEYETFGSKNRGSRRNQQISMILKLPLRLIAFGNIGFFKWLSVAFGNAICCPTVSFHKSILGDDVFVKYKNEKIYNNLDWNMWITLSKLKKGFLYSPKVLLKYRLSDMQGSHEYMANGVRYIEDYECFKLIWPRTIATLLMRFYRKSYDVY